jgi:hypothetical protein
MSKESRKINEFSIIKELIWTLLLTVVTFLYSVIMLLIISFLFNSIIDLSFKGILLISGAVSCCVFLFYIIKGLMRH